MAVSAGACGQTTVLVYVIQRSGVSGGLSSSTGSVSGLMGVGVVVRLCCDARPSGKCEPFEHVFGVATLAALWGGCERWHGTWKEQEGLGVGAHPFFSGGLVFRPGG